MASRNGQTVYDIITDGWSRKVSDFNGRGSLGISIPANWVEEHNVELGDHVAITKQDGNKPILELHFKEKPPGEETTNE